MRPGVVGVVLAAAAAGMGAAVALAARIGAVTGKARIAGTEADDTADEEIEALRRKMGR